MNVSKYSFLLILFFIPFIIRAQVCDPTGNIVIFSNYDGGVLIIDVNQDVPDLKVGIVSYEPVTVEFTGEYVENITEVVYAGYQPNIGTGNFHCSNSPATTSVESLPNATITILDSPPVTLISPDVPLFPGSMILVPAGNNDGIVGCSSCSNDTYQGGSNTAEQVEDYFATYFNSLLLFHKTQYECWCGTQNLDVPPTCCFEVTNDAEVVIDAPSFNLCSGQTLTLDAGSGYQTYSWSTNEVTQTIEVSDPGFYSVTVTSECGTASDNVFVAVSESPELDLDISNVFDCLNGSISVSVTNTAQSPGPYVYTFLDGNGVPVGVSGNTISDLAPDMYTVIVESTATGCETTALVDLINDEAFYFDLTITPADCSADDNGEVRIDVDPNLEDLYSFIIYDAGGNPIDFNTISGSGITVDDLPPGSYDITVTGGAFGCMRDTTITIGGTSPLEAIAVVDGVPCSDDESGSILSTVTGGNPPFTYTWTDEDGQVVGGNSADLLDVGLGVYFLEVVDQGGCTKIFDFEIESPFPLLLDVDPSPIKCHNETNGIIDMDADGGQEPYLYSIDGQNFFQEATFPDLGPGTYMPMAQDANGCLIEGDPVTFTNPEELTVDLLSSASIITAGDGLLLTAVVPPAFEGLVNYEWKPALGLSCQNCPQPFVDARDNTTFQVIVTTASGCMASDFITVEVIKRKSLYIPNAFTPNGKGENNVYNIFTGEEVRRVHQFKIFSRWGNMVYDADSDPGGLGWDGTFAGQKAQAGVYAVLVEVEFVTGEIDIFTGSVLLVR
jgi:gliding motility-associated-like protein